MRITPMSARDVVTALVSIGLLLTGMSVLAGCYEAEGAAVTDDLDDQELEEELGDKEIEDDDDEEIVIPEGERKVGISVDAASAVAGRIAPGDRVDLLLTTTELDSVEHLEIDDDELVSTFLLQNVAVLTVDDGDDDSGQLQLGLSLTPEEAEVVLMMGRFAGELELVLRSDEDLDMIPVSPRPLSQLWEEIETIQDERSQRIDDRGLESAFADREETDGVPDEFSERIRTGMRAMTVFVDKLPPQKLALRPGQRVDLTALLSTEQAQQSFPLDDADAEYPALSVDVLNNVEVLAVDPAEDDEGHLLTLSVTPDEVEVLMIVEAVGELSARVRRGGDVETAAPEFWSIRTILDDLHVTMDEREERLGDEPIDEEQLMKDGERIATISTDVVSEASVRPDAGEWIDVHATFERDSDEDRSYLGDDVSEYNYVGIGLLQRVAVLGRDDDGIAVSVSPREAHLLELASTVGTFDFLLRNDEDLDMVPIQRRTISELFEELFVVYPRRPCDCGSRYRDTPPPCPPGERRDDEGECVPDIKIIR